MEVTPLTVCHPRLLLIGCVAALCAASAAGAATSTERSAQDQLLSEINEARATYGRAPLRRSAVLTRPARQQSAFVARTGEMAHEGPDGNPFYVRLYRAGFPRSKAVGETLGIVDGCSTGASAQIVRMWLDSPPHRRILLSPRYRVVGVGVAADDGCGSTGYTADFGG
jgi:uncharacterized protein YkwD